MSEEGQTAASDSQKPLSETEKERIAGALSAIDGFKQLSGDVEAKLIELDRQLGYRRFYFPGADLRLYVEGNGTDTDTIHYVGKVTAPNYDPRYEREYITECHQYGLHKHMLVWNGHQFHPMSYADVQAYFKNNWISSETKEYLRNYGILGATERQEVAHELSAVYASLDYFNKWEDFEEDYPGYGRDRMTDAMEWYSDYIDTETDRLVGFIGQNPRKFVSNDYGFEAPLTLAFDADKFVAEYNANKQRFDEYKERLWEYLSQVKDLMVCANVVNANVQQSGTSNLNINQANSCIKKMEGALVEEGKQEDTRTEGPSEITEERKTEETTHETPSLVESQDTVVDADTKPNDGLVVTPNAEPAPEPVPEVVPDPTPDVKPDVKPDESKNKWILPIVISIIVIILIAVLIVVFMKRRSTSVQQVPLQS